MTKQAAAQYLPLIKALADGETIQFFNESRNEWRDISNPSFDDIPKNYRIKPQNPTITELEVGDVFYCGQNNCRALIIQPFSGNFYLAGQSGLYNFSDTLGKGFTHGQMINFLNKEGYVFVKNINNEIADLIKS